jgi:hypothetical protein
MTLCEVAKAAASLAMRGKSFRSVFLRLRAL